MARNIAPVTLNERGEETHPSFAVAHITRGSYGGRNGGKVLFQSEVAHQHAVTLTVARATRERHLNQDWVYPGKDLIEITMTEAQWASLCASDNGRNVPVTLDWLQGEGMVPGFELEPRLAVTAAEAVDSAREAMKKIEAAMAALEEKNTVANRKALRHAIDGLPKSVEFATKQLHEHVEKVKEQTKVELEAEALRAAQRSREAIIAEHKAAQVELEA